MAQNKNMIKLIEMSFCKICRLFIKHPESLEVKAWYEGDKIIVEPRASYSDVGRVLGTNQANYQAIENILTVIAGKCGSPLKLAKILPAKVGTAETRIEFKNNPHWEGTKTKTALREILSMFMEHHFEIEQRDKDDKTTFNIIVSKNESLALSVGQIAFSLSKIFHAMGRHEGRLIFIEASEAKT